MHNPSAHRPSVISVLSVSDQEGADQRVRLGFDVEVMNNLTAKFRVILAPSTGSAFLREIIDPERTIAHRLSNYCVTSSAATRRQT